MPEEGIAVSDCLTNIIVHRTIFKNEPVLAGLVMTSDGFQAVSAYPDTAFLHVLADAAAGQTLPRFRQTHVIDNKCDHGFDPVTEADRAAERVIRALIGARFPEHGILGEEEGGETALDELLNRKYLWVIDPIDGTRAFISGLPVWGTLIGFYENGRAVMGIMDQPFTGERHVAGPDGSFYRGPDGQHTNRVRPCASLDDAILFTTSPALYGDDKRLAYDGLEAAVRLARYGCDCYAFTLLASGHVDLVVEAGLQPYDIAALIAIIEQAGGIVTCWDGSRPEKGGNVVAAGSRAVHEAALKILCR